MPNLTTPFLHLGGTDINKDMDDVQNWSISLIDELKYLFCNLDAGNCQEAAKVKAQNIDCTRARISSAQIQSLKASKIKTGTLDVSDRVTIQGESDAARMVMNAQTLIFYDKDEQGEEIPRIYMGFDGEKYVFLVQNSEATQGIHMDENGNIIITGLFSTGTEGQARTIIDKNGIQSYDANGNKAGLWSNDANNNGQRFSDLTLYDNGHEIFQVYNGIGGVISLRSFEEAFLTSRGYSTTGKGTWSFENGASGSFQTADGKTVTVSGGLITDIS